MSGRSGVRVYFRYMGAYWSSTEDQLTRLRFHYDLYGYLPSLESQGVREVRRSTAQQNKQRYFGELVGSDLRKEP